MTPTASAATFDLGLGRTRANFRETLLARAALCPPDAEPFVSELRKRNARNKAKFYLRWHLQGGALRVELERARELEQLQAMRMPRQAT